MNAVRQRIWDTYRKHPFQYFKLYNELVGMTACAEDFECEGEEADFEEVVFAVDLAWLVTYKNNTTPEYWTKEKLHKWLKTEHTQEDAAMIFRAAIADRAVSILEFD